MVQIYKKGQGKYTRTVTFVSAMVIAVVTAAALSDFLGAYVRLPYIRFGAPSVLVVLVGVLGLWLVNRPKSADFLIATEGEMKKVSWSSKKEIVGSTKVVIITTFVLAALLFGVDLMFVFLFKWMRITGTE